MTNRQLLALMTAIIAAGPNPPEDPMAAARVYLLDAGLIIVE